MNEEELRSTPVVPVHARLTRLRFDEDESTLHASVESASEEYAVGVSQLKALYAAQVRAEPPGKREVVEDFMRNVLTASTWPRRLRPHTQAEVPAEEELHFVVALRVKDVAELWYLVADSFNFRESLGGDANYATEFNLRTFVRRLAIFAPGAAQNPGFRALVAHRPMPAPLSSLIEFFRDCP